MATNQQRTRPSTKYPFEDSCRLIHNLPHPSLFLVPGPSLGRQASESGGLDRGATYLATSHVGITLHVIKKLLPLAQDQDMELLQTCKGAQCEETAPHIRYIHS